MQKKMNSSEKLILDEIKFPEISWDISVYINIVMLTFVCCIFGVCVVLLMVLLSWKKQEAFCLKMFTCSKCTIEVDHSFNQSTDVVELGECEKMK